MKYQFFRRTVVFALLLCLLVCLIPMTMEQEAQAAIGGVSSLTCSGFISNSTAKNYIDMMMRYHLDSNTTLQNTLTAGNSVLFMFEGGSDNYWNGSDYTNSAYDTRNQAVIIEVKLNSSNNVYISYYCENCSSIPGDPSWCTSGVAYSGSVTIYDGVYRFFRTNHTGPYAAFQLDVNNSAANGYGYYTPLSNPNGEKMGCSGINIHTRASNIAAGSDLGWAWSEGCQVIGTGDTSSNEYNAFFKSVTGATWNPWVSYYSSPKQLYTYESYGYSNGTTEGYYVVDRQLGLMNASGTSYGSGSLINLYNKTALTNITASSATAKAAAEAQQDYKSKCTRYDAHCTLQVKKDDVDIMTQPSTYSTANNSSALEAVANGETVTATGLYCNTAGNYWYEVICPDSGKTGFIYANQVNWKRNLTSDIKLSGASYPNGHVAGNTYSVTGTIKSTYSGLTKVGLDIRSGFGTSGTVVTGGSASISNKSYSMDGSAIDNATVMNELAAGKYTYQFYATYTNYYATDNKTLMSSTGTVNLSNKYFVVISSSTSQSSCSHSYSTTTIKAATCTATGNQVKSCSKCGLITESTVAAKGHSYGDWTVTEQATCTTAGSQTRSCTVCSTAETQTVAAGGHSYDVVTIPATCTEYAKKQYTCANCGDSYKEEVDPWSAWSTTKPSDDKLVETKTQYRYSDYQTQTSYATSLSGYTLKTSAWEQSGTGTVSYVNSWPSGFYTGNAYYTKYNNKSSKKTASETATEKTVINSDAVAGYLYYHWCYSGSFYSVESKSGSYTTFHCYYKSTKDYTDYDSGDGSYEAANSSCCSNSDWYWIAEVNAQKYTTYKKLFTYERWTDYTAWSDTAATASSTRKVETRTVYRYLDGALGDHTWDAGKVTTAAGCTTTGVMTYTCTQCAGTKTQTISPTGHQYIAGTCSTCNDKLDFYLFGFINGADYGCEADWENLGIYKFVDGTLTVTFESDSYVAIKGSDNASWYMFQCFDETTGGTLYNTTTGVSEKMFAPAGAELTFTLTVGEGDTLHLSYVISDCPHNYDEGVITENATCISDGTKVYTCSICDNTYNETIPSPGHHYEAGTCTNCGNVLDFYLFGFINGRNYGCEEDWGSFGDYQFKNGSLIATFDSDSYIAIKSEGNSHWYMFREYNQTKSGTLYNSSTDPNAVEKMFVPGGVELTFTLMPGEGDSLTLSYVISYCPHSYGDGEVTKTATCTENGTRVYTCAICGDSYSETITALGHSYTSVVTAPGCVTGGYTTVSCDGCGDSYVTDETDAIGHDYIAGTCTNCGDALDFYLFGFINGADYGCESDWENLGVYKFVDGTLTATFESDSYIAVKTSDNKHWYMFWSYEPIPSSILYNTNVGPQEKMFIPGGVELTFTLTPGQGDSLNLSYVINSCTHNYGEGVVTDAATCTQDGTRTYTCDFCGDIKTETIQASGHSFVEGKCESCGEADPDYKLPSAVTVTAKYPGLAFMDEIYYNIYFVIDNPNGEEIVEMGLITWTSPVDGDVTNAEYVCPGAVLEGSYWKTRSQAISAKNMGEELYFKAYAKLADGTYIYSVMRNYSAKSYCENKLAGSSDMALKSMCVALMNYGAAAQEYFGYKTDELMNAGLTEEQKALAAPYSDDMIPALISVGTKGDGLKNNGGYTQRYPSVIFGGALAIKYNFTPANAPENGMKLYIWTQADVAAADALTLENASQVIDMTDNNGVYVGTLSDIAAKNAGDTYYACGVYESNGTTYYTGVLAYSVSAYCKSYANNSASSAQPLASAAAIYAYYADTYLNA